MDAMDMRKAVNSQFLAALAMLEQTIQRCPPDLWVDPQAKDQFWQIAYHALFYTHLYLQESEAAFRPWPKHRKDYHLLGPIPWEGNRMPCDRGALHAGRSARVLGVLPQRRPGQASRAGLCRPLRLRMAAFQQAGTPDVHHPPSAAAIPANWVRTAESVRGIEIELGRGGRGLESVGTAPKEPSFCR